MTGTGECETACRETEPIPGAALLVTSTLVIMNASGNAPPRAIPQFCSFERPLVPTINARKGQLIVRLELELGW